MSQLEYIEEYEDQGGEAEDTGRTLLTTLLVSAGGFMLASVIVMLALLGKNFQVGMEGFYPKATGGSVIAVSDDGHFCTFRGPSGELVRIGDELIVHRGNDYVGRVIIEQHPDAKVDSTDLDALSKAWGISVSTEDYVGRVVLDMTVTDITSGMPDIQTDDKVASVRPAGLKSGDSRK